MTQENNLIFDSRLLDKEENVLIIIDPIKNNQPKNRVYWADCLRIFSMLNIILLHCANCTYEKELVERKDKNVIYVCIYNCVTCFAVPVFVMLSGTFFLDPNKKFSFKRLIKKNISRLLTAFYFWSAINGFINVMKPKNGPSIFSSEFIKKFFVCFFTGEEYLWFILMIIGCYLCIPILRRISDNIVTMRYFLGLWIIWGSVIPTIRDVLNMSNTETVGIAFSTWIDRWHFHFTLEYIGYFVAGYYIFKYVNIENIKYRIILYILGLFDLIIIISSCIVSEIKAGTFFSYVRDCMTITTIFYSLVIFIFFKHEIGIIHFSKTATKSITKFSSLTFGMYLSHIVIRSIFFKYLNINQDHMGDNIHYSPLFGIPFLFITISSICLLISAVISKIPILNKYII